MNSLILRLLVEHRLLTRELAREHRKGKPALGRIMALRARRLKVKLAIARHLPRSGMALRLFRQILAEVGGTKKTRAAS